jgi:4-amino-4-deoxy-L-arabinose transferase-like glycosyltransferase
VKEWKSKKGWIMGYVIIASGLILFFNLWARSLENHDYLRYAEVSREMIRSGEWVVPHYNGEVYIDKPPFLFWLMAIPSYLYGSVTPLIARLPSAFSAWIGVIILFLWGKRIFGTIQSGLVAGGVLLSSYQYFFQARMAKTDMVLCLFVLLSLYFFYLGYSSFQRRRMLFYGLSFFFMGLGVLTKGPFGLFIPFLIIVVFLIKERKMRMLVSQEWILGYFIFLLTVLPWILLFFHRVGLDESIKLVKETHILTRQAPFYFYFIEIWGQFFPWSILLPFLFIHLWRQRGNIWSSGECFFLIWFVVTFLLLTLFKYRASRYLLPALPSLGLMISGMWKKKMSSFLIPFLLFILIWHTVEINWIRKNPSHSPGLSLVGELRPIIKESTLFGYQLDVSTVEEINFYLDRVIPLLKETEDLSVLLGRKGRGWVLMPKKVYEEVRTRGNGLGVFIREFQYKKEGLVLVSY